MTRRTLTLLALVVTTLLLAGIWSASSSDRESPAEFGALQTPTTDADSQPAPGALPTTPVPLPASAPASVAAETAEPEAIQLTTSIAGPATVPLVIQVVSGPGNTPVAGAHVVVSSLSPDGRPRAGLDERAVTDLAGFTEVEVPLGPISVTALSGDRLTGRVSTQHGGFHGQALVRVVLSESAHVRGIVLDPDGQPIADVAVTSDMSRRTTIWDVRTGDDGRFDFPAWMVGPASLLRFHKVGYGAERISLMIDTSEGFRWCRLGESDELVWNTDPVFIDVELTPAKSIRGRLVDDRGEPAAGVHVKATGEAFSSFVLGYDDMAQTQSDSEGRWVLTDLRADVDHAVLCESRSVGIYTGLAPSGLTEVDLGLIRLRSYSWLAGRVLDGRKRPVPGALVTATHLTEVPDNSLSGRLVPAAPEASQAETGLDGAFRVAVPPTGEVLLAVRLGARSLFERRVEIDAADIDLGDVQLRVEILRLDGLLVGAAGRPLADELLEIQQPNGLTWARVRTQPDGRFEFASLPNVLRECLLTLHPTEGGGAKHWRHSVDEFPLLLRLEPP